MADRKNNETTSWNADEVRRQQTQRKQRKKMRRARFWAIYCAGVVLGSCLLAGLGWLMVNDVCALNKAPLTATVEIEKGDSVGQIASKLKKAGIIKYKLLSSSPVPSSTPRTPSSPAATSLIPTWTTTASSTPCSRAPLWPRR